MATVFVKFKDRSVSVTVENQKVSVKALTEACGEPIKCLKSGLQSFNPDKDGIISNILIGTTYNAIPVNAAPKPGGPGPKPSPPGRPHPAGLADGPGTPEQKRLSRPPPPQPDQKRLSRAPPPQPPEQRRLSQAPPSHSTEQKRLSQAPSSLSTEQKRLSQAPEKRLSRAPPPQPPSHDGHHPQPPEPPSQPHPSSSGPDQKRMSRPPPLQPSHEQAHHHPESPSYLHPSSGASPEARRLSRTPSAISSPPSEGPASPAQRPQRASQHMPSASTSGRLNPQRAAPQPPPSGHRPSLSSSCESMARRGSTPPSSRPSYLQQNDSSSSLSSELSQSQSQVEEQEPSPASPVSPEPAASAAAEPSQTSPAPSSPASTPATTPTATTPTAASPNNTPLGSGAIDLNKLDKKERKKVEQARTYLEELRKKNADLDKLLAPDEKSVGNVPRWVPDDKSDSCTYCGVKFTLLERRHHCRKCGALLCSTCTQYKLDLPDLFFKKPVRVCVACFLKFYEGKLDSVFFDEPPEEAEGEGAGGDGSPSAKKDDAVSIKFLNQPQKKPYVDDGDDDEDLPADKNERMRIKCIREIVVTEEAYVSDLKVLEEVFVIPLRFNKNISPDIVQKLFSNVEMLRPVHEELLKELGESKAVTTGDSVGKAFVKMCQYLKMYSLYCSNHENAIDTLVKLKDDPAFQHALSVCQTDERAAGQNLDSYIIKPVQRVCKYPLFFRELLKYTPKPSEDYDNLDLARTKIEEVVSIINEGKRKSEEQRKIMSIFDSIDGEWEEDLLQPARGFVTEIDDVVGTDMRTNKKHTYSLFIFTDLIVVGKQHTGPGHHKPYLLKGYIPMKEAKVIDISDTETQTNVFEVRRGNAQATLGKDSRVPVFQFVASDAEQKNSIMNQLKKLIKEYIKSSLSRQSSGLPRTSSSSSLKSPMPTPSSTATTPTSSQPATAGSTGSSLSVSVPPRSAPAPASSQSPSSTAAAVQSPRHPMTPGRTPPPRPSQPKPTEGGSSPAPARQPPQPPARTGGAAPVGGEQSHLKTPRRAAPPPPCQKPS